MKAKSTQPEAGSRLRSYPRRVADFILWQTAMILTTLSIAVVPGFPELADSPAQPQAGPTAVHSRPIALKDALELVRLHNPELAVAAQELRVALGEIKRAGYLSQSNLEIYSEGNYRERSGRSNSQDWRVGFLQQFEVFGQRGLRIKAAQLGYERSQMDLKDQVRLISAATKLTFLDALRSKGRVELLSELASLDANLLRASRARMEAGEIGQLEYNSAEIRHSQAAQALIAGQENYRLQRSSLGRLLGGQAGPEPQPAGDFKVQPLTVEPETLLLNARRARPDFRAHQLEVARLSAEIDLNRKRYLPNPSVGFFLGHENNTEHYAGPMLGLSMPLFNRPTGEAMSLAARQAQARSRLRGTELTIEREVRDACSRYDAALRSLRIYEQEIIVPARQSFELLETAFAEGKIDLLRLSIAEREAFAARVSYLDSWFDVLAAQVALELATNTPLSGAP